MDAYKFGCFVAKRRKEQNMTQKDLAAKVQVTDKAVSKWERGLGFRKADAFGGNSIYRNYSGNTNDHLWNDMQNQRKTDSWYMGTWNLFTYSTCYTVWIGVFNLRSI